MFLNYPNPIKFEQGNAKHISFFFKKKLYFKSFNLFDNSLHNRINKKKCN
jgi:hypothetical protein